MKLKPLFTAMTALSLVVAPTMASAAPVSTPLTQPATEAVQGDNAAVGSGILILILAIAAIGLGIYAAADAGSDAPTSP